MPSTLPLGRHRWPLLHATCRLNSDTPWPGYSASSISLRLMAGDQAIRPRKNARAHFLRKTKRPWFPGSLLEDVSEVRACISSTGASVDTSVDAARKSARATVSTGRSPEEGRGDIQMVLPPNVSEADFNAALGEFRSAVGAN